MRTPGTGKMPVLFLGHGSPMNAILENEFSTGFRAIATTFAKPLGILVFSAHWETRGTYVTAMEKPKTLHDFGGFPRALYEVNYPADGNPKLAKQVQGLLQGFHVQSDYQWGFDHGTWSVTKHLYPKADIPIIQLSLNYLQNPDYHYNLAKKLSTLREQGILIIGSGNMVHNLRELDWQDMTARTEGFPWAMEAYEKMMKYIVSGNHKPLIHYKCHGKSFERAVPTPEHFLPLLTALALQTPSDELTFFNEKFVGGALGMTSLKIG